MNPVTDSHIIMQTLSTVMFCFSFFFLLQRQRLAFSLAFFVHGLFGIRSVDFRVRVRGYKVAYITSSSIPIALEP